MDIYVRKTLLWRLQILDEEIQHMAEDIIEAREQLKGAEEQLILMNKERVALAAFLTEKE